MTTLPIKKPCVLISDDGLALIADADGIRITPRESGAEIVRVINSFEPHEDLISKLITALAEVRDLHPTAWGSLQESVLDLSREMGF